MNVLIKKNALQFMMTGCFIGLMSIFYVSEGIANILNSVELPITIVAASLILVETATPLQWLGTAIILIAIALNEHGNSLFRMRNYS